MTERVPSWAHDLHVQCPGVGPFDFKALDWSRVEEGNAAYFVAKIALQDFDEFVHGEEARGGTKLNSKERKASKKSLLKDALLECYRGVQRKEARARSTLADAPDENKPAQRRSKIERGQSVKCGCVYAFRAKVYSAQPDIVVLKFKLECSEHIGKDGNAAHQNSTSSTPLSIECREFVYSRLLLRCVPKIILEGERDSQPLYQNLGSLLATTSI